MSSVSTPAEFYSTLAQSFDAALATTEQIDYWIAVAGYRICLSFAGHALVPLLAPALEHLAISAPTPADGVDSAKADIAGARPAPDLTLRIWDSRSTGTPKLIAPWRPDDVKLRGEIPAYSDARYLTTAQRDMPAVSMLDQISKIGYLWIADAAQVPVFEQAAPMKVLLHWWLRARGLPMIHAAALGTDAGAALILGKTGSGKSTTSLLCLDAGMHFLADDRCLLQLEPSHPRTAEHTSAANLPQALCIYNSAKLHPEQMENFPHLAAHLAPTSGPATFGELPEKSLVYVHRFAPAQIVPRLPIRALLLARVAHVSETTITPIARMTLLRELITSTLVYQPGATQTEMQAMTTLVQRVPAYQLNLGTEWRAIPDAIRQIITQHAHAEHTTPHRLDGTRPASAAGSGV